MRFILRGTLALVVSVCALSGVAAASASASEFVVAGSKVSTAVTATATRGATTLHWKLSGGPKVEVKCTGGSGAVTLEKEGVNSDAFSYTGCSHLIEMGEGGKETELSGCEVELPGGGAVKGKLVTYEGRTADEFSIDGELSIKGPSCALRNNYVTTGSITCLLPEVEAERLQHELRCEASGSDLTAGGQALTIETSQSIRPTGTSADKKWSATDPGHEPPAYYFGVEGGASMPASITGTRGASTLSVAAMDISIKCTGGSTTGSLEAKGASSGESSLTGCSLNEISEGKEVAEPSCTVGPISFHYKDALADYGTELGEEIAPSSGTIFAEFSITGSSCAFKKADARIEGFLGCGLPEIGVEKVEHQLACKPQEGEPGLEVNGKPATFESTETLKLTGSYAGKKWNAS